MTTASICTIGDEILIGQIVDTNSSKISQVLNSLGIKVKYMFSIGDDRQEIINQLNWCLDKSDVVIVTGGLGPTKDDITKDALMALTGGKQYVESPEQMTIVKRILDKRGIAMLEINRRQAFVPNNCKVIPNEIGTAPCMVFPNQGISGQSVLYSLPGVPFEAVSLLPHIAEDVKSRFSLEKITHYTILTFGIPESSLADQISQWEDALPSNVHLAYLPNPTLGVRLRLTQFGGEADFTPLVTSLKGIIGDAIYGEGEETLQSVIGNKLKVKHKTLALAESCTGGHLSELITSVAGCSEYYKGSVTSYSNEIKMRVLGVSEDILKSYGAVSEQCVREMASGVLRVMDTDYAVATSGIAGPGGATPGKPVGTAWLGVARKNESKIETFAKCVHFASNRAVNIERFASYALDLLRKHII